MTIQDPYAEPVEEPVVQETVEEPADPPPPPIEAPPELESLAEQVYRESHTVPESTGPSDWVPNRPNIRPPEAVETEVVTVETVEGGPVAAEGRATAADLIEQAQEAEDDDELDEIEAQADGRVTVLDAVTKRREELASS
jgi:hypothetical protein